MADNYSYQEAVQIGQEAARVLNSPVFAMAYNEVLNDLTNELFAVPPGHHKQMDDLRWQQNGLARVTKKLRVAVMKAEEMIQRSQGGGVEG